VAAPVTSAVVAHPVAGLSARAGLSGRAAAAAQPQQVSWPEVTAHPQLPQVGLTAAKHADPLDSEVQQAQPLLRLLPQPPSTTQDHPHQVVVTLAVATTLH